MLGGLLREVCMVGVGTGVLGLGARVPPPLPPAFAPVPGGSSKLPASMRFSNTCRSQQAPRLSLPSPRRGCCKTPNKIGDPTARPNGYLLRPLHTREGCKHDATRHHFVRTGLHLFHDKDLELYRCHSSRIERFPCTEDSRIVPLPGPPALFKPSNDQH